MTIEYRLVRSLPILTNNPQGLVVNHSHASIDADLVEHKFIMNREGKALLWL